MTGLNIEEERINFTPIILYIYHIQILQNEYLKKRYENITPRDITYLMYIFYNQNCSQRELSELLFVSESGITQSIQKLEKNGYIARTTDETKKSRKIINLTIKGKNFVLSLIKEIYEMESELLKEYGNEDVVKIKNILYKYAQETINQSEKLRTSKNKNLRVLENPESE